MVGVPKADSAFQPARVGQRPASRLVLDTRSAFVVTALFFLVNLPRLLSHGMWRDELQAWLIARDSASVGDLFFNLRYEGHPGLWHILLWLLSRLTTNPLAMAIL